ncbi:MAG: helix-turn-helix domain-containing protein [Gammaproteobacteria bacterium]|nr:helix-turn-helix domain-containing protein [Gammaproteobacteria bacterium]
MNIYNNAPIDSILKTIGEHLADRTKSAGLKKKDLAALAEVNQNTITAVLAGGDLKVSTLIRLSRVLGDTQWLNSLLSPIQPTPLERFNGTNTHSRPANPPPARRPMGRKNG